MESRKTGTRQALALVMAMGERLGRITPARLMSPEEVAAATRGRADLEGKLQGWCLCTEVPDAMWQRALEVQPTGMPNVVMAMEVESGRTYVVVAIQAADWQHRLCVPLVGEVTARWLRAITSGVPLYMSVANAESDRAFVSQTHVPSAAVPHFRNANTLVPEDLSELLEEAFGFVAWGAMAAKEDDAIEQMPLPQEVSLSLLLPAEVEAQLERRTEEWAGRRAN